MRRVAIIGGRFNPFFNDRVMGGLERAEQLHVRLFSEVGNLETVFITNADSETVLLPGVETIRTTTPSKYTPAGAALGRRFGRERNRQVLAALAAARPDLIVNHDDANPGLNRLLAEVAVPSLTYVWSHRATAGGIGVFAYIKSLYALAAAGHTVVGVSEASRREWESMFAAGRKWLVDEVPELALASSGAILNAVHLTPVAWDKPALAAEPSGGARRYVTAGRLLKIKRHHVALSASRAVVLYCPSPKTAAEEAVLDRLRFDSGFGPALETERILLDRPYAEVMAGIGTSRALLSCSPESFGLTAFEANALGVPTILSHPSRDHPIVEATAAGAQHGSLVRADKRELAAVLAIFAAYPPAQRQAILDATWEAYNPRAAWSRMEELIAAARARRASAVRARAVAGAS